MNTRLYTITLIVALVTWWVPANGNAVSFSEINRPVFKQLSHPDSVQQQTNPFIEGAASTEDLVIEDLQLMGIAVGHDGAYAIVNGLVIEEGDSIAGFKVKSITHNKVLLKRLDEVFVLSLGMGR